MSIYKVVDVDKNDQEIAKLGEYRDALDVASKLANDPNYGPIAVWEVEQNGDIIEVKDFRVKGGHLLYFLRFLAEDAEELIGEYMSLPDRDSKRLASEFKTFCKRAAAELKK